MLIEVGGKKFKMNWKHTQERQRRPRRVGKTQCFIEELDGPLKFEGSAECSVKDQYRKETGRRVSMGRATLMMANKLVSFDTDDRLKKVDSLRKEVARQYDARV